MTANTALGVACARYYLLRARHVAPLRGGPAQVPEIGV